MTPNTKTPPGEARMWELAATFPRQLEDGLKSVPRHDFARRPGLPVAIAGMGGSGIAGELLAGLAARGSDGPVVPVRDFTLPSWVRPPIPVVFVSYSGSTAETLAAYEEARSRGVERAVVASGGKIIEQAKADKVTHVQIPAGQPPRASLGYLFGALAGILREAVPSVAQELPRVAQSLAARGGEIAGEGGRAHAVAKAWRGDRDLWVYAPDPLVAVARRWKTQSEENTKRLGHFDAVPELLHNAIVAWDALDREEARRRFVVLLRGRTEGEAMARRMDYLSNALREQGSEVEEVVPASRGPLAEMLELSWTGDYTSLWAARRRGIDPLPVPTIDKMKAALAPAPVASAKAP